MLPSQLPDLPAWVPVAVDTETSGLHPDDSVMPIGMPAGHCSVAAASIAWVEPGTGEVVGYAFPFDQGIRDKLPQADLFQMLDDPNLPESEWVALLDWLEGRPLVFHNAKFDLLHITRGTRHWPGRDLSEWYVWDTGLAAHIIWPRHRTALKPTAERLGIAGGNEAEEQRTLKAWIKSAKLGKGIGTKDNPRYDLVEWEVMEPYARVDAELTIALYHFERAALDFGEGRPDWVDREIDLSRALYDMETRGVGFDRNGCLQQASKIAARIDRIKAQLPFNPTVNGAKAYYFRELGYEPIKTTDKGAPQLDDEVRRILLDRGAPWVAEYDELVSLEKALSMWYRGWPERIGDDGRLRCTFRQAYVRSGRLSVERIQLQAVPKDDKTIDGIVGLREFFIPREGHVLWNLDLSQAELRVASKFANCVRMLEMLEGGADLHGITTEQIFGIDKSHPDWKFKRDIAKRLTFGGIFQIGPKTFQATLSKLAGIDWPLDDCKSAVYSWRDLYPEFGWAYNRYDKMAADYGYVRVIGDERSYFGERDWSNTGWSRMVQGSLAKFLKLWLPVVNRQAPGALVLTVHDSTVLELPALRVEELVPGGEDGALVDPVALEVAERGSDMATEMFGIRMPIDVGVWRKSQKHYKDDDVCQGAKR